VPHGGSASAAGLLSIDAGAASRSHGGRRNLSVLLIQRHYYKEAVWVTLRRGQRGRF